MDYLVFLLFFLLNTALNNNIFHCKCIVFLAAIDLYPLLLLLMLHSLQVSSGAGGAVMHRPAGTEGMCLDGIEPPELRIELQPPTEQESKRFPARHGTDAAGL